MKAMLILGLCMNAFCLPSPPRSDAPVFRDSGTIEGGNTHHLNLERISFKKTGIHEEFTVSFSAGTRKFPSKKIPPYQLRLDCVQADSPGRLVLLLQGIGARNMGRLALSRVARTSSLVAGLRVYPPLEDGDTAIEISLKTRVEFKAHEGPSGLRLVLRAHENAPDPAVPGDI